MTTAILTDFVGHDEGYSLCRIVQTQIKMFAEHGEIPLLFVRGGSGYPDARVVVLHPGQTGDNQVHVTADSAADIERLTNELRAHLVGVETVLTHDLIYQPNMWAMHVAARRIAAERPELHWLHWVHSGTALHVAAQTGAYQAELSGPFPHARLVAFHVEEIERKAALFGYPREQVVVVTNPLDLTGDFHPLAQDIVARTDLLNRDIVTVYPCRLDRGKQPHIIIEIFAALAALGYRVQVIIADFHSSGGDKATYRTELKAQAQAANVPVLFTSDVPGADYCVPHRAIMDLLEVADVLIQPSVSETDSLIVAEAAWQGCLLLLNFDLPRMRLYAGQALLGQFSSAIDVTTGLPGETNTAYRDRAGYMAHLARSIADQLEHNPVLLAHRRTRQERNLITGWRNLQAAMA
jgi:glycosyltransferase involved in cell wall biosynthesis